MTFCLSPTISPRPRTIWVASFDPGTVNLGFAIEEIPIDDDNTRITGHTVLFTNHNVSVSDKRGTSAELFIKITDLLDEYIKYWDLCTVVLIEQQMQFGATRNTTALKVGQHILSYFIFRYGSFKMIMEYPARLKTRLMGAPPKLSKPERKKWAVVTMK